MVDVVLQGVLVLCCINKDEGDESLPRLALRTDVVNAIFLKYSKADYPRAMQEFETFNQIFVMMTRNITRYNYEHWRISESLQTSKMEYFCVNI